MNMTGLTRFGSQRAAEPAEDDGVVEQRPKRSRTRRLTQAMAVVAVLSTAVLGLGVGPASASSYIPTGASGSGSATCYPANHSMRIEYDVDLYLDMNGGTSIYNMPSYIPTWVEVWAYTRPVTGGSWTYVAHAQVLAQHSGWVLNQYVPVVQGVSYQVAFVVRYAQPGGTWSRAVVDYGSLSTRSPSYWQGIYMKDLIYSGYCRP